MQSIYTLVLTILLCAGAAFAQVSGSGTTNFVPRWTGSNTLGNTQMSYNPSGGRFAINSPGSVAKFSVLTGLNYAMWIQGTAQGAHVIVGESTNNTLGGTGVEGSAHGPSGVGVHGIGGHEGVLAEGSGDSAAIGLHAKGFGFGLFSEIYLGATGAIAGVFSNPNGGDILLGTSGYSMDHKFRVDGSGNVFANTYNTGGADFAEAVAAGPTARAYEPGDLLVIDESADRKVSLSQTAYSTLVAGIYSTKPGIVAGPSLRMSDDLDSQVPLAVIGIVPCKVTAANGSIKRGDLLVSSSEPGYAMKGTDQGRLAGAVVGKAMQSLTSGKETIEVLVTLQ
jgi:hypothetical protein